MPPLPYTLSLSREPEQSFDLVYRLHPLCHCKEISRGSAFERAGLIDITGILSNAPGSRIAAESTIVAKKELLDDVILSGLKPFEGMIIPITSRLVSNVFLAGGLF